MDQIKSLLKWVGGPVIAILAAIYYLFQKNSSLKDQLKNEQAGRMQDKIESEIKELKTDADTKESDYAATRDKFLNEHSTGTNKLPGSDH